MRALSLPPPTTDEVALYVLLKTPACIKEFLPVVLVVKRLASCARSIPFCTQRRLRANEESRAAQTFTGPQLLLKPRVAPEPPPPPQSELMNSVFSKMPVCCDYFFFFFVVNGVRCAVLIYPRVIGKKCNWLRTRHRLQIMGAFY